jgi:hypothetical protein
VGIAEAYKIYVDADVVLAADEVDAWVPEGLNDFVEGRVAALLQRWRLMNVYLAGGFERAETAEVCRRVARNCCSWLMKVTEMEAYDWTYLNSSSLMPAKGSQEYRELAHVAASLDIGDWMGRWREDVIARLGYYCTMSDRYLTFPGAGAGRNSAARKLINRTANAISREMDGVIHAIQTNNSKPKRRKKEVEEEE